MAFSNYKVMFSASTVLANGEPLGTYRPLVLPTMFCCMPCAIPAIIVNDLNPSPFTVLVNTTASDIFHGWVGIAIEAAVDFVFNKIFGSSAVKGAFERAMGTALEAVAPEVGYAVERIAENAVRSFVKAAAKAIAKGALTGHGPGDWKAPIDNRPWGAL